MNKFRFLTILIKKPINFNRLIALLISGIIIFCFKYYLSNIGYVPDFSLIFIIFCGLLRSITLISVESIRSPNLKTFDDVSKNKNFINKK